MCDLCYKMTTPQGLYTFTIDQKNPKKVFGTKIISNLAIYKNRVCHTILNNRDDIEITGVLYDNKNTEDIGITGMTENNSSLSSNNNNSLVIKLGNKVVCFESDTINTVDESRK